MKSQINIIKDIDVEQGASVINNKDASIENQKNYIYFPKLPLLQKILDDMYYVRKALYKFSNITILLTSMGIMVLSLYNISIQRNTESFFGLLAESASILMLTVIYHFFNKIFYIRVEKYKSPPWEQIIVLFLIDLTVLYCIFKIII